MKFRTTLIFFGLLLTMLWVFGYMVAHKKAAGDPTFLFPSLQERSAKVDKIVFTKAGKDKAEITFTSTADERWFLEEGQQKVRVEGFRVDKQIITQIRNAKPEDSVDVSKDPAVYGLTSPQMIVTLTGTHKESAKEWVLKIGKETADKSQVYVSTSEKEGRVFAVAKQNIESLFFENPNNLRSRRLFDFGETGVTGILVKEAARSLRVKLNDDKTWSILEPPIGNAGFESEPDDKKKDPKDDFLKKFQPPTPPGGVKGLLTSIIGVLVEDEKDFQPLGKQLSDFGLAGGKETTLRIEVTSTGEAKGVTNKEILLIGNPIPANKKDGKSYYYARLDSDDGVVKIDAKRVEPILKALKEPGKLRSLDIANFDPKRIDVVVLKQQGQEETQFFLDASEKAEPKFPPVELPASHWQMVLPTAKKKEKANDGALKDLLEQVLGKKAIQKFLVDETPKDIAKLEANWGLDKPVAELFLYVDAVEKAKKEEKKEEKKDDKAKKDPKEKKDETKSETGFPTLKKDAKAVITIAIGKVEKDFVNIRRTLEDGKTTSWFTLKKEFVEKILPAEGVSLAYLDPSLPSQSSEQVIAMKLFRTTDKGPETFELERRYLDGKAYWHMKDKPGSTETKLADNATVESLVAMYGHLPVKKWIKKLDDKEDMEKYGLKNPVASVTLSVRKKETATEVALRVAGMAGAELSHLTWVGMVARLEAEKPEIVTIDFGKENTDDKEKEKPTYARHSGSKLLFVVDTMPYVKFAREKDLRDRTFLLNAHAIRVASDLMMAGPEPICLLNLASPQVSGMIHQFDSEKVTKVALEVRTAFEQRKFAFDRIAKETPKDPVKDKDKTKDDGKDKQKEVGKEKEKGKEEVKDAPKVSPWTWKDQSNIAKFKLDPDKVAQFVKDISKLETSRFAGYTGGLKSEHMLPDDELTFDLTLTFEDGKTVTLRVGTSFQNHGYFANSSHWPETVFFLSPTLVGPIARDPVGYFAKPRALAE